MTETVRLDALVGRLRQHALPDPHDEREVLHAPLFTEAADEIERLEEALEKALLRACALEHPKSRFDERDDIELFLRDAYAAGANAKLSRSLYTAMEYAKREAPRLRTLLAPNAPHERAAEGGPLDAVVRRNGEKQ